MFARAVAASLALASLSAATEPAERPAASKDIAAACNARDGWSDPAPPAHVFGNTWYVGTCGISVVLVRTSAGLVLFDGGPEEAAPLVLANIAALGFDPRQVKWILPTHEHFDHGGAIAALQQATGAKLAVGPFAATAFRTGRPYPDDPQTMVLKDKPMPPARVDKVLKNGGKLVVGTTTFTAWATPTHSPGSTSWTWQSCEAGLCRKMALADSISTISADGYRFTAHRDRVLEAKLGLTTIGFLPCEVLITPHPSGSNLLDRLSGKAPLVDPGACMDYEKKGRRMLDERLARERAAK